MADNDRQHRRQADEHASRRQTPALFTRKATGLVREARTTDALFYNVMWASVALSFAFFWLFYGFALPGLERCVAFLIAAALGLPGAFLYAMLAQIMPRTGGDYVFNSRSLHPSLGFAANFSYCFWLAIIYGVYTTYLAAYGFGAFGRMMAGFTGSAGWLDFGDWFSTEHGLFITGTRRGAALGGGLHRRRAAPVPAAPGRRLRPLHARRVPAPGPRRAVPEPQPASSRTSTTTPPTSARTTRPPRSPRRPRRRASRTPDSTLEATLKSVSVFWYIFGFLYSSNYFAGRDPDCASAPTSWSIPGAVLVAVRSRSR